MSDLVMHGTTILTISRGDGVVVIGDGQVSFGNTVMKSTARKLRRLSNNKIIAGFAGATADAFTLFERLEGKLEAHPGQLMRSCVELAKDWRTDKYLRRLEAMMVVVDESVSLIVTGGGDVLEPEDRIAAIGSGGNYAFAAAKALMEVGEDIPLAEVAHRAMSIAAKMCIYTNNNFLIETIGCDG